VAGSSLSLLTPAASQKPAHAQVINAHRNSVFDEFKAALGRMKLQEAITKAGTPSTVNRAQKDVPICTSYHLRGLCWNNCSRALDRAPHTTFKDDKLYAWFTAALN
jgi:hypothetical protein